MWLWNDTDGHNWGNQTAQVSEAGITVQTGATATEIVELEIGEIQVLTR